MNHSEYRKGLFRTILAGLLGMSLTGCAPGTVQPEEPEEAPEKAEEEIYIFYTSDVHCGMEDNITFAGMKALVNETKEEHQYVSLIDLGDYVQGGSLGALSKGELIVDLMNEAGYDVVTIGNHEFDYGMEQLAKLMGMMNADIVACNVKYTGTGTNIFADIPGYVIKDYGGTKVAFVGVLTPESIVSSTPTFFMEDGEFVYNFYTGNDGQDLYDQVQKTVDEARKDGADYVIAMTHLGSTSATVPYDSVSLIANTTGIDAVLDGHSHSTIIGDPYPNRNGEDVILSSVGTKLMNVGELIIEPDGTITTLLVSEYDKRDADTENAVAQANASINDILSRKVADLDYDMNIADEEGIRMTRARETTPGDFAADALRTMLGTDVAFINSGSVRANIRAGEVFYSDLMNVSPFLQDTASCYATGQQIMDVLEYCSMYTEGIYKFDGNAVGEFGGFLQVSGLHYTIDTSVKSPVIVDENNMFSGFAEGPRRVTEVLVEENGEYVPIDPEKTYTVGSIAYVLFKGGDGNTVLRDCERITETGPVDIEVMRTYLEETGGFGDRYRTTDGRITVK